MVRFLALMLLVFVLIGLVPGDSRSFLSGAFELSGLDIGDRHVNPWTLSYMSFHFGFDWGWQLLLAFGRSFLLATLSALFSIMMVFTAFALLNRRTVAIFDLGSGLLLSLVSVLVAPVFALVYLRHGPQYENPILAYSLAAVSISFVAAGSYLKFIGSKYVQVECRELLFGLRARGISTFRYRWVHLAKLMAPDFLVLFLSRYASYVSGVFVAELVFNLRGLGWYFAQAFQSRSGLLLMVLVLLTSLVYLCLNHAALFLASTIDLRRRHER